MYRAHKRVKMGSYIMCVVTVPLFLAVYVTVTVDVEMNRGGWDGNKLTINDVVFIVNCIVLLFTWRTFWSIPWRICDIFHDRF